MARTSIERIAGRSRGGLYKAMAGAGPLSSAEVAERAGVAERSVREWLRNQAAGGYVAYDAESDTYELPPEQAMALADEESPFYLLGAYELIASPVTALGRLRDAGKLKPADGGRWLLLGDPPTAVEEEVPGLG